MVRSRRAATAISLGLICALAGVALLFFSPLHKHDRLSSRACVFSQFEHGFSEEASTVCLVAPAEAAICAIRPESLIPAAMAERREPTGRAPPA